MVGSTVYNTDNLTNFQVPPGTIWEREDLLVWLDDLLDLETVLVGIVIFPFCRVLLHFSVFWQSVLFEHRGRISGISTCLNVLNLWVLAIPKNSSAHQVCAALVLQCIGCFSCNSHWLGGSYFNKKKIQILAICSITDFNKCSACFSTASTV